MRRVVDTILHFVSSTANDPGFPGDIVEWNYTFATSPSRRVYIADVVSNSLNNWSV